MSNYNYEWKREFHEWIEQFGIRLKPSREETLIPLHAARQAEQSEQPEAPELSD